MAKNVGMGFAYAALCAFALAFSGIIAFFVWQPMHIAILVLDAQQRFAPAPAVVDSSEVIGFGSGTGNNAHTVYRPAITYRYVVPGAADQASDSAPAAALASAASAPPRTCIGRTYMFGIEHMSGDEVLSRAISARYPRGQRITVWYDPAAPEVVLIERDFPTGLTGAFLCLQLFVVLGAFLLYSVWYLAQLWVISRRCLLGHCGVGWEVPRLGRMRYEQGALALGGRISVPRVLGWVALGYGLGCLALGILQLYVGGRVEHSWASRPPAALAALALALCIGIALAWIRRRTVVLPLLVIDEAQRRVVVEAYGKRTELAWSKIAVWRVRWQRAIPGNDRSAEDDVLYLVDTAGTQARVHMWRDRAVAAHIASELAQATGARSE